MDPPDKTSSLLTADMQKKRNGRNFISSLYPLPNKLLDLYRLMHIQWTYFGLCNKFNVQFQPLDTSVELPHPPIASNVLNVYYMVESNFAFPITYTHIRFDMLLIED
jgi:hypothetical protein